MTGIKKIEVYYHNDLVGYLAETPNRLAAFQYADSCGQLLLDRDQLDLLYQLGGSSGGTRPKILLTEGGRDWIIKFPAGNDPSISGKREFDYSICAKDCGITMTETALIPSSVCEGYFNQT